MKKKKKCGRTSSLSKNVSHYGWSTKKMFQLKSSKTSKNKLTFTEVPLCKKCPYSELFWSVFSPNAGKYGLE